MLVLSRKENETVEFPGLGVVIRVFGLTRRRVQLGIDAPISLKIIRGERRQEESGSASVDSIAEHVIGVFADDRVARVGGLNDLRQDVFQQMYRDPATAMEVKDVKPGQGL